MPVLPIDISSASKKDLRGSNAVLPSLAEAVSVDNQNRGIVTQIWMDLLNRLINLCC